MFTTTTTKPKEVNLFVFDFSQVIGRTIESDMSTKRFEATGGITTTIDYEDKEQFGND